MFMLQKSNRKMSSRQQINIQAVDEDMLILSDNEYRLILQASYINFELRSEEEQDNLIEIYQSILNSLPCSIQILVRVREMDMDKYIDGFKSRLSKEKEKIYCLQIKNYCNFVYKLVATNKILTRDFYIVIPATCSTSENAETIKERLKLSANIIGKNLSKLGMHTRQLTSLEILDLFYSFYSPEQAKVQSVTDQTLALLKDAYL